jgi:hypothetical protein
MSARVLQELAAESLETAERLGQQLAREDLDSAEAEYLLASGLAAIQRVPWLWPIIRRRIGSGTTGATAHQLLTRLLDAVDKYLSLAALLKESARVLTQELGGDREVMGVPLICGKTIEGRPVAAIRCPERFTYLPAAPALP